MTQNTSKTDNQYDILHRHISSAIRQARILRGISQQELAARLGITYQQVQKYESGKSKMTVVRLYQVLDSLELPHHAFFSHLPHAPETLSTLPAEGMDDITLKICRRLINMTDKHYKEKIKEAVLCLTA